MDTYIRFGEILERGCPRSYLCMSLLPSSAGGAKSARIYTDQRRKPGSHDLVYKAPGIALRKPPYYVTKLDKKGGFSTMCCKTCAQDASSATISHADDP